MPFSCQLTDVVRVIWFRQQFSLLISERRESCVFFSFTLKELESSFGAMCSVLIWVCHLLAKVTFIQRREEIFSPISILEGVPYTSHHSSETKQMWYMCLQRSGATYTLCHIWCTWERSTSCAEVQLIPCALGFISSYLYQDLAHAVITFLSQS